MIVGIRQVEPQFGCDPHVGIVSRGEYLTKCEKLAFFTMGNFSTQYTQIMLCQIDLLTDWSWPGYS